MSLLVNQQLTASLAMPRQIHTRSVVKANKSALWELSMEKAKPKPAKSKPQKPPSDFDVSEIDLGSLLEEPASHLSLHIEYKFRGMTWYPLREEFNRPEEVKARKAMEDKIRAKERAARLKRQRTGGKTKGARKMAWKKGGGLERRRDANGKLRTEKYWRAGRYLDLW